MYVLIKQEGYATNEQKLQAIQYLLVNGATLELNTEISIIDLANQYLPEAIEYLRHPEHIGLIEELELMGDLV